MQVDFNVLKGDIDIAEVETMLSREYDEIWSRAISLRYVCSNRWYYSYAIYIYKEGTGQEGCDRMDARAILPMATRGKGQYPSPRLATLSNSQPSTKTFSRSVTLQHAPYYLSSLLADFCAPSLPNDFSFRFFAEKSRLCSTLYYFLSRYFRSCLLIYLIAE